MGSYPFISGNITLCTNLCLLLYASLNKSIGTIIDELSCLFSACTHHFMTSHGLIWTAIIDKILGLTCQWVIWVSDGQP